MCECSSHNGFLTAKGLEEAAQREPQGLLSLCNGVDPDGASPYLDKVGSVSGLGQGQDLFELVPEVLIEEQHRRFLNGS